MVLLIDLLTHAYSMLFFNKKKAIKYDFSEVGVDMHSHLIPGVDDGAKDLTDSIDLINGLFDLGFSKLYTTPHSMQGVHPNTKSSLTAGLETLKTSFSVAQMPNLSSEYYLDEHFSQLLETQQILPLPGNRILLEFSQVTRPLSLEDSLFELALAGYHVVLAHPERYLFFHKHFQDFVRLKDMGLEFQVNALSLSDHYGKNIRAMAEKLIDHQLIDFLGTDIHRVQHLDLLKAIPNSKYYQKLLDQGLLKNRQLLDD